MYIQCDSVHTVQIKCTSSVTMYVQCNGVHVPMQGQRELQLEEENLKLQTELAEANELLRRLISETNSRRVDPNELARLARTTIGRSENIRKCE